MTTMQPQTDQLLNAFDYYQDGAFFSDPEHHIELIGLGQASRLQNFTLPELVTWHQQQNHPVFGGFPFDQQLTGTSQLMNGTMLAPAYVINTVTGTEWGRRPSPKPAAPARPIHLLRRTIETDWQDRVAPVLRTLQTDAQKQKVVLGMQEQWQLSAPLRASQLIRALLRDQPHTYHFFLKHHDELFLSATPERLVRLHQGKLATAAVAGSVRRGATATEDKHLATALQADSKNQAEHQLVVTEIQRRLRPWAHLQPVASPQILTTPQIQHLYTPITGSITQQASLWQLVTALHPTPALGGVPTAWAQVTIRATERCPRGLFAAPVGYALPNGDGEFVIGIRSLWSHAQRVNLFAGAGILAASTLAAEAREIQLKTRPMQQILKEQVDD
ncbi:chorismate-binding protein [Fructilactobacillus myrtifloralis]|uniref:isochorismate synthase n=1 Tax=Fructilactobacillus myrtifloralis TaxID=2940301 RepID=A0ABY5BLM5_9LACO|nr:isochorismate synthase [Fructilactobacillus myrtifloralis]USS84567.1 chorismate-binding protein [Fructilactobacillus myrtifloralis]